MNRVFVNTCNMSMYLYDDMIFQVSHAYDSRYPITKSSFDKIKGLKFIIDNKNISLYRRKSIIGYYDGIPIYLSMCYYLKYLPYDENRNDYLSLDFESFKTENNDFIVIDGKKCYPGTKFRIMDDKSKLISMGFLTTEADMIANYKFTLTKDMINNYYRNNILTHVNYIEVMTDMIELDDKNLKFENKKEEVKSHVRHVDKKITSLKFKSKEYDEKKQRLVLSYDRGEQDEYLSIINKKIRKFISISTETYKKIKDIIDADVPCEYIYKMVFNGIIFIPVKYKVITKPESGEFFKCTLNDGKNTKYQYFNINNMEHTGFKLDDEVFWSDNKISFLIRYSEYLEKELKKTIGFIETNNNVRQNKIKFIEITKQYLNLKNLWREL